MKHYANLQSTGTRNPACRIVLPSPASALHRRARNSIGNIASSGSCGSNHTFRSSLANSVDVSPISTCKVGSPMGTTVSETLAWAEDKTPQKRKVSTFQPVQRVSKPLVPKTNRRTASCIPPPSSGSIKYNKGPSQSPLIKTEDGAREKECSNAERIQEAEEKLHENNKVLRLLSMSQSRLQKTIPSLFAYRDEVRRLQDNTERLPKPVAEHKVISAMVELEMKKRSIRAPVSFRSLSNADVFGEHMASNNLDFLLKISPNAARKATRKLPSLATINRTCLSAGAGVIAGLTPCSRTQQKAGNKTMFDLFLTSVNASNVPLNSPKKPDKVSYNKSLENLVETYNNIQEKCKELEADSAKGLVDFSEAMRECQKKVEETRGEKLLLHIRKEKRPRALVELQRLAAAGSSTQV